jgi:hypothetical protein
MTGRWISGTLPKGQGTVRFEAFLSETEGEVFSGFKACSNILILGQQVKTRLP